MHSAYHVTGKLSNAMRSAQNGDMQDLGRSQNTPVPWDARSMQTVKGPVEATDRLRQYQEPRELHQRSDSQTTDPTLRHVRNDSGATGADSSAEYADTQRRHDYDVQAMEASLSSPRVVRKNPIPPPIVTVRSEFPTLNRSRQQQSLTCLVTIEVPVGRWTPLPDDTQSIPPLPSIKHEERYGRSKSPAPSRHLEQSPESSRVLDELTEDLHSRVDNWHGLDFSRYAA